MAEPEPERVVALRREAFLRAGYSSEQAADLAARQELDLQHVLGLVKQGFPPEVAYGLLVSGSRPVF